MNRFSSAQVCLSEPNTSVHVKGRLVVTMMETRSWRYLNNSKSSTVPVVELSSPGAKSGQDCDLANGQAPIELLLALLVGQEGTSKLSRHITSKALRRSHYG